MWGFTLTKVWQHSLLNPSYLGLIHVLLEDVGGFCTLSNVEPSLSVHPQNHTLALGRMDYIGRGPNFSPSESPYLDQEMVGDVGPCT